MQIKLEDVPTSIQYVNPFKRIQVEIRIIGQLFHYEIRFFFRTITMH